MSIKHVFVTTFLLQVIRLDDQIPIVAMRGFGPEVILAATCAACTLPILSYVLRVMYQRKYVSQLFRISIASRIRRYLDSMLGKRGYVESRSFFSGHLQVESGLSMIVT